ncbi:efflux RND transporter permease subunit [Seleniivibrio sp.]|uniref:efflux RND transporter permease subunit n=1 Tax=Seleniivibrio sp. TaxID=2898801 RepID=UPI0025E64DA2|nr:efflux RND transporter permease subunit [Seleniivibrio sp.]MCD8552498.1 efflux RND transporter permease subunit [Seleniivibrio sp.]
MKLSEITIRKPVLATVLSLIILLIGFVAYSELTVREYPNIDEPTVSIQTTYTGASPDIIESRVTKVIEDRISGIDGIKSITSQSRQEQSNITVVFNMNIDPGDAAADIRDRVGRVRGSLPDDIDEPVITKVEADASPIIFLTVTSTKHSPAQISDYMSRFIVKRIELIDGVAAANIYGERRYAMRVWLDPDRMAAAGVTVADVKNAVSAQNLEVPGGRVESQTREFSVLAETGLNKPEEFANIVIADRNGYLLRIKDIGHVEMGIEDQRSFYRLDGKNAIGMGVVKQSTANPLNISKDLKVVVEDINKTLPDGMKLLITYDSSVFIDHSIKNVYSAISEAVLLVIIIIFLFLRNLRSTIIPLVTIPVSLVGAFAIMWGLGFSINTLTLLAFVLAVGLVVDDAIVVLENIHRHIEGGTKPFKAAIEGMKEISLPIISMTLTLAAVYVPVAFTQGRTGKLFTEFAITLAGAVIVSGFIALTLTPMMCSKMLKENHSKNRLNQAADAFFDAMDSAYEKVLRVSIKSWLPGIIVMIAVFSTGFYLLKSLPSELAPIEDRSVIFGIYSGPDGATPAYSMESARKLEEIYATIPERTAIQTRVGTPVVADGRTVIRLRTWDERTRSQQDIAAEIAPKMAMIPDVRAFPINPPSLGLSATKQPVQFVIKTTSSYAELNTLTEKFIREVSQSPMLSSVKSDLKLNTPELKVSVNRDKAAAMGISVEDVNRAIETMFSGSTVTQFKMDSEQYDVILKTEDSRRTVPQDLDRLYVRSGTGEMVPLSNLVDIREGITAQSLNHFDRSRAAVVSASLNAGYSLGEALNYLNATASKMLPENYTVDYDGESREFRESSGGLVFTFILAILFIYLMLSAQFESFIDPFIIMLTVPLSMTGALLALKLTGNTLNIYSQIGLITLIGLITKHGILIVEFANQLQLTGLSKTEAVVKAATLRLRPILMTTSAMVLGSIPLAFAEGAGAESRHQLGWVIVGGLLLGTTLTLLIVPLAYRLMATVKKQVADEDI